MKKTILLLFLFPILIQAQTYDFNVSQNDSCSPLNLTFTNLGTDTNAYSYHWLIIGPKSEDTLIIWDTLGTSFTETFNTYDNNPGSGLDSGFIQVSLAGYDSMGNYLGGIYEGIVVYWYNSEITISSTPDSCTGNVGTALATGCCNTGPYTYAWSNGSTSSLITGLLPGTYFVTMTDAGACSVLDSAVVGISTFTAPIPICIVSVDSVTKKNMILWEKLNDAKIISYNIYKETTSAGAYGLIGNSHVSNPSIFIDSLSAPAQNAARYKISSLDTCGNESAQSPAHKTIHLTIGLGVPPAINLNWDNYEGFNFGEYYIWRGSTFGNLTLIDTIQSSLNSYTDQNPPPGTNFFAIQVVHPQGCNAGFKSPDFYGSSFSNIENNGASVKADEMKEPSGIHISPNPTNGKITISGTNIISTEVYNLMGEKINSIRGTGITDLSSQPGGIYFITVKSGNAVSHHKIVKQ